MIKCLIYCTKSKDNELIRYYGDKYTLITKKHTIMPNPDFYLNGTIVAQFDCEKVEEIRMLQDNNMTYETKTLTEKQLSIKSCLEGYQLGNYLDILYEDECGYAIHISNLKVFNTPLDFKKDCIYKDRGYSSRTLTKAPQNMQYVYDRFGNQYVLISIRPEWVEKILNGEKTIEIRKSIVNKLKELI